MGTQAFVLKPESSYDGINLWVHLNASSFLFQVDCMCFKIHFKLDDELDEDDLVFFIIIDILEIAQIKAQGLRLFRKTHFEWYLDSLFTKLISNYLKPIKG